MLLALGHLREHHPFARFGPANQLTTARAVLVVLVAGLIGESELPPVAATAAAAALAATMLDGLDGWLALAAGASSPPIKSPVHPQLLAALPKLQPYEPRYPWVLFSGLMRYGFVAAGWLLPWMQRPLHRPSEGVSFARCDRRARPRDRAAITPPPARDRGAWADCLAIVPGGYIAAWQHRVSGGKHTTFRRENPTNFGDLGVLLRK
jgi:hypothetical protein